MNVVLLKRALWIVGVPTLYAVILRLFFGVHSWQELYSVMSLTFLVCLPSMIGALTVYLSPIQSVRNLPYRIFMPWAPVMVFFLLTLALKLEGWACWLMVLPLFLIAASLGGLAAGHFRLRQSYNRLQMSLLALLPLVLAPLERMASVHPETYKAYTCIDIRSAPEKIWDNVTRVREIPAAADKGWLTRGLGFPRPVKAELNFNGVGGYRKAVFTNGLLFHEKVTEYEDQRRMVFSITANPHEIPSTTMDEHVVIGGRYFDVLKGTYELEKLSEGFYRLHLYSHFTLSTTFNFYASWWARWIMKDIQNNILQVQKYRSENI